MWISRITNNLVKPAISRQLTNNIKYCFAAKKDLYQILGVNKQASQNQIKKAYYKLAQKHHPDKNPGPQSKDKFAEISNAYQILSDQNKRNIYNQTGQAQASQNYGQYAGFEDIFNQFRGSNQGGQGRGGMNFQDIFGEMFGMGQQAKRQQGQFQPENVVYNMQIMFDQSVNGVTKKVQYRRKQKCGTCHGSRAKPGTKPQKCTTCQGSGAHRIRQGMFVMQTTCESCGGQGTKITSLCQACSGTGLEVKKVTQDIMFPRGIDNNATLKFRGKGHVGGDLLIKVLVRKNPNVTRNGNDAHSSIEVSVVDAVLGTTKQVKTIYGQKKEVKIPPGTQNGQQIRLPRQGFYFVNSQQKGSHVLKVKVIIPKNIPKQQRELFQKLKVLQSDK